MKKRLASILLLCCMVLTLLPLDALAITYYDIGINMYMLDSDTLTDSGATYDPTSNTLTLKGMDITARMPDGESMNSILSLIHI